MASNPFRPAHPRPRQTKPYLLVGIFVLCALWLMAACEGRITVATISPTEILASLTPPAAATLSVSPTDSPSQVPTLAATSRPIASVTPSSTPTPKPVYVDPRAQLSSGEYLVYHTRQGLLAAKFDGPTNPTVISSID